MLEEDNSNHPFISDILRDATPTQWPCVLALLDGNGRRVACEDERTHLLRELYYNQPLEFQVCSATECVTAAHVPGYVLTMRMTKPRNAETLIVQDRILRSAPRITRERVFGACMGNYKVAHLTLVEPEILPYLIWKTGTCMLLADTSENWNRIIYCAKGA